MMDQYLKDNLDRNQLNTIDNAINEFPVSIKKKKKKKKEHGDTSTTTYQLTRSARFPNILFLISGIK